jgi:hypothetical protein
VVSFLAVALLLAAEPWVLWVVSEHIGSRKMPYERSASPSSAYEGAQECFEDVRVLATRRAETYRTQENVKRVTRDTHMGRQEHITVELKDGGHLFTTFMCLPHPVRPE